jgi:hypothetical protein
MKKEKIMDSCVQVEPSILDRLRWKLGSVGYKIRFIVSRIGMGLIRWSAGDSIYVSHAKREFDALGWPGNDDMQKLMCEQVIDLLYVFSDHGHSGSSAPYAVSIFKRLAMFEPIGPLTGADSEWGESFCNDGTMQNKRCSHVFKRPDGTAYDINGKVFREPNGCCYTSKESSVDIEFPYTPKTEYIDVPGQEENA